MRNIITLIFLAICVVVKAQTTIDSIIVVNSNGDSIRYTTVSRYVAGTSTDSILTRNTATKRRGFLSPADLPVSSATQTALNLKANIASPTFTGTVSGITAAMVGLGNVNNTSDASKPVSTAQQTALDLKANIASPTFTGTVGGITATMVGLGNVNNTSDANKPISSATQTALDTKASIYFGIDAGSNDSYVITATPVPAAYTTGMMVIFKANTANTTGCSINVSGLGAKTIVKRVNTTPATGDILQFMLCQLIYDGANFVLLNPIVN